MSVWLFDHPVAALAVIWLPVAVLAVLAIGWLLQDPRR